MSREKLIYICLSLAFSALCSCGCSTLPLAAASAEPVGSRVSLEIAVEPFNDGRHQYKNTGQACFIFPLVPCGWYYYESPDREGASGIGSIAFSPLRESQDIFIDALKKSKIFPKVHLISDPRKDKEGELVVKGRVMMASYSEKFWTYGLSIAGAVFWLFGAPIITSHETFAVEIQIYRRGETRPSWTYEAEKEVSVISGLYYKSGEFDKPKLGSKYRSLRRYLAEVIAAEFIRELDRKLHENPSLFKPAAGLKKETPEEVPEEE